MAKLTLQRPIVCGVGYPKNWLFNVRGKHDEHAECKCVECHLKEFPLLKVGQPIQTGAYDTKQLGELGFVGLYTSEPEQYYRCLVCKKTIVWNESVSSCHGVVHVACLDSKSRLALQNVGYDKEVIVVNKMEEKDDTNREVDGGQQYYECTEEGSAGQGGESVQGVGEEESTVVKAGGNGTSEQPEQSGLDIHTEQASKGAEEGSKQEGPREEAPDAEKDPSSDSVLRTTGIPGNSGG